MRIIAVDDERLALLSLTNAIMEALPDSETNGFRDPKEALSYAKNNEVDIAFLDVEMRGIDGIALAKELKDINPSINIIFVTGFSEYALDALKMHASGYLEKPVSKDDILEEINNLRNPLEKTDSSVMPESRIRVQTFGNFDVFIDNKPVTFKRARSKEILAYLIDKNGSNVGRPELASILWEDEEYDRSLQKQLQIYISELFKCLRDNEIEDIIIRSSGIMCVDPTKFVCDYYSFLKGEKWALNQYHGEYMSNFSWAEFTNGYLTNISMKNM
ncbi:MAG: response regulator [Eubacterium sp.]|nr:response regulator [Eubacterium sp.]